MKLTFERRFGARDDERRQEVMHERVDSEGRWGIRTASFRDPGGHIWEVAH